jgi:hypothetical protein
VHGGRTAAGGVCRINPETVENLLFIQRVSRTFSQACEGLSPHTDANAGVINIKHSPNSNNNL